MEAILADCVLFFFPCHYTFISVPLLFPLLLLFLYDFRFPSAALLVLTFFFIVLNQSVLYSVDGFTSLDFELGWDLPKILFLFTWIAFFAGRKKEKMIEVGKINCKRKQLVGKQKAPINSGIK